ncbi:MFS transporter [Microbacterium sp.]|uniref:MFS transporter n=1 Tax=Microbacterium sp. TaxID=51671 RepID=UPI002B568CF3|nr:MFS transporter [Microbacterium sp.]HWK77756.1 MFS transporter [Microbacterium sp.]
MTSADLRALATAVVTIAFLGAVIGGVGAPLITSVAIDLGVPLDAAQWTLTITLFSGAISAPVLGRLGAGPQRRATILVVLASVAAGGLLTALPLPFWTLLLGRALQGLGLGVVALLMSVARDLLPTERAHATIATVSVASTVGIGVAYPLMGLIDQLMGLRAAYLVGFLLSLAAVGIAWWMIPEDRPQPRSRLDVPGAVLLGIGILGVLAAVAQPVVWDVPWVGTCILIVAVAALAGWVVVERRTVSPLVDLRLLGRGPVVRANAAMLFAGVGMYLLFSLLTRYVQTPLEAGYGLGLSGALAGAALIPFSVLGFVAGRLTPRLSAWLTARWTFAVHASCVVVAAVAFAGAPAPFVLTLAAMAVLGFGVGGVSAIMPSLVLDGVPRAETSSVLSMNQIVRSIGFSIGSALAGMLLASTTAAGAVFPPAAGYPAAAVWVLPLLGVSALFVVADPRVRR